MQSGRVVRQDNLTKESMKASATTGDQNMFRALTDEGGLSAGALPGVKAATEAGAKKMLQMLDDESRAVAKAKPKARARVPEEAEQVVPKTTLEWGAQFLPLRGHAFDLRCNEHIKHSGLFLTIDGCQGPLLNHYEHRMVRNANLYIVTLQPSQSSISLVWCKS